VSGQGSAVGSGARDGGDVRMFRTVPVDSRGQPVGPGPSRPGDLL